MLTRLSRFKFVRCESCGVLVYSGSTDVIYTSMSGTSTLRIDCQWCWRRRQIPRAPVFDRVVT